MRVERIGLEHHRQTAFCRWQVGGVFAVDADLAARHVLEPSDQAQKGGFAATRWANEYNELSVFDGQVQRRDNFDIAETFGDFI